MYYPMRVVRERRFKLIWNIAHGLPYPLATDLWESATWQTSYQQGPDTPYAPRTVWRYIHRPEYELFDLELDPLKSRNLAADPKYAAFLTAVRGKLATCQRSTTDAWMMKQIYE